MPKISARIAAAILFLAVAATGVLAQDVVMNSAETIDKGNFKLALFPMVLLNKNGSGSDWGLAGRIGYGFSETFDIEVKGASFAGLKYYGGDIELWLSRGRSMNASFALGVHWTDADGGEDSNGFDATLLLSTVPSGRLELYGGLRLAFDSMKTTDTNRTLAYAVPGIEYRLGADLDLLAEVGIALNGASRSYFSVGLALYIR
jgi:hypothetical protein